MLVDIELHEAGHSGAKAPHMELYFPGDATAPGRSKASAGARELALVQEHVYPGDTKSPQRRCFKAPRLGLDLHELFQETPGPLPASSPTALKQTALHKMALRHCPGWKPAPRVTPTGRKAEGVMDQR